jgi:hypothetical protein
VLLRLISYTLWRLGCLFNMTQASVAFPFPPRAPEKSASKKVAAKLFILQGEAEPLSSVPVWAEPSQLLFGMWKKHPSYGESHFSDLVS